MMYPFLTLNDQEGRLLSRQKTRGPQDKHLRDFLTPVVYIIHDLTPCSIYLTPLWHEADPTFPGWGHCIKIRVICHSDGTISMIIMLMVLFSCPYSLAFFHRGQGKLSIFGQVCLFQVVILNRFCYYK